VTYCEVANNPKRSLLDDVVRTQRRWLKMRCSAGRSTGLKPSNSFSTYFVGRVTVVAAARLTA